MARLRDPDGGCPWDLEQDFASIAPYTIEETYEVDDAIRRGDLEDLRDELGDLLLQVVFHARMAQEARHFDFDAVVTAISDKLVRRHPHVFADAEIASSPAQTEAWERQKAEERARRGETSAADGIPRGLPALLRARKLLSRADRAGLPLPDPKLEIAGLEAAVAAGDDRRTRDELGDLLLAAAALARSVDLDPEAALRDAVSRFETRLRELESAR